MEGDEWKDQSQSSESAREYAEYLARLSKVFVEELEKAGFSRPEAIQLAIVLVPSGLGAGPKS